MSKIIVGVEDSPHSRDAVTFGRQLAVTTGARLVLATVYPQARIPSRAVGADFDDWPRADAEATLIRMRRDAGDAEVEKRALGDPSPARALHQLAVDEDAALIVIGSSHTGDVGRVLAGTTAERLLHGSPCPVAVVPQDYRLRAAPIRRILVAYDGSGEAQAALQGALTVACAFSTCLRVVQVVPPEPLGSLALAAGAAYTVLPAGLAREARTRLEDTIAKVDAVDSIEIEVALGDPLKELAKRSHDVDLLITGSRGYGPHRAVMAGSVSGRLVRRAACPVLVLPRGGNTRLEARLGEPAAAESV